jgi:hypothetical protein
LNINLVNSGVKAIDDITGAGTMKNCVYILLTLVCLLLVCCETQHSGIRYGHETGGAARIDLDASCVPASFRDLVPMAEQWGCADPEAHDVMEKEMTPAQAGAVREALHARVPEIRAWLGATGRSGRCGNEAAAFGGLLDLYEDISDMSLMKGLR